MKDYKINERAVISMKKVKFISVMLIGILTVGLITAGCVPNPIAGLVPGNKSQNPALETENTENNEVTPTEQTATEEVAVEEEQTKEDLAMSTLMASYDVASIGRADPFMPYGEYKAYEKAEQDAIREANAHNSEIAKIRRMQGIAVREKDDISPYSFNLPVPPTSLASSDSAAAKITRTKVVGIMYNELSPSAIINVDDKDYLVRQGDKIIGQEYKVVKINKDWITVSLGSNVYSAAIGELFSKDELDKSKNDLYNLKNRFGGRRS